MALFFPRQYNLQFPCNQKKAGGLLLLLVLAVTVTPACSLPQLYTYRPVNGGGTNGGKFVIPSGEQVELTIFGSDLSNDTVIKFTRNPDTCSITEVDLIGGGTITLSYQEPNPNSTISELIQRGSLTVELSASSSTTFYFCVFGNADEAIPVHQGSDPLLGLVVQPSFLPLSLEIIFIIILMALSGLFSGLNLGLLSLDPTTLKIITDSGTKRQRIYAKLIYKVRKHGNYLLCTLLLGNVLVNSTLTILLDEVLPSGVYAVVASTLAIVIFGEIIPQAICSRHGLVVGAWTMPLTVFFMFLTFPLSLPLSLILNFVLGKEIGSVYNRDQLLKLLHVTKDHHDLENDEVDIISGVLGYKKKLAKDVMTKFDDIFCVNINSVLDFKMMRDIYDSGFSRIPVYEDTKENIVHLLYVRDLAFVDPDDKTTLASHVQFYQHELLFFYEDTPLDDILKGFLEGRCHLGVIQTIREVPDKDPVYEAVGVITLEDILEEILQREIVDETDRFVDNRTFEPRKSAKLVDVSELAGTITTNSLTSQQRLAVYQFLSTEVEPFKSNHMSSSVLKRLLTQQNIVSNISFEEYKRKNRTMYSIDCPANYFCLILEGCVQVEIGRDGMKFESRSFSYFGAEALCFTEELNPPDYKPDFTALPLSDCLVITVTRAQYAAAHRASVFDGGKGTPSTGGRGPGMGGTPTSNAARNDLFGDEWARAESKSFGQPQQRTPKASGLGLFLTRRQQAASKRESDQLRLLSLGDSSEAGSPNGGLGSPVEITVEMDGHDSTEGTPVTFRQRLDYHDQVAGHSPDDQVAGHSHDEPVAGYSPSHLDSSYQSTTV